MYLCSNTCFSFGELLSYESTHFLAFFWGVILHYGLRPRRKLIFRTLHGFTNLNCKKIFLSAQITLNHTYCTYMIQEAGILHGQHTLVLWTLSSRNPESSQFCTLFILRFQLDFIYHSGLRSRILLNIYMGTVYLSHWTEKHDSFF